MRDLINWQDQEVEFPNRYIEQDLGNGMIQHTPAFGRVRNQGTPQNAANFNSMDQGTFEAMLMAAEALRMIRFVEDELLSDDSAKEELKKQDEKLAEAIDELKDTEGKDVENLRDTINETMRIVLQENDNDIEILRDTINEVVRCLRLTQNAVVDEIGFFVTVDLTNSQTYPFNNSKKTVTFPAELIRNSKEYSVTPEIVSSDGFVKDIEITDKLLNGFKVAYTGSATKATLKLYVKGGKSSLNGLPYGITA